MYLPRADDAAVVMDQSAAQKRALDPGRGRHRLVQQLKALFSNLSTQPYLTGGRLG